MKTIDDFAVEGQRVLVRDDLNVPLARGRVMDDGRIRAALPTLTALLDRDAEVIICAHLGRPAGRPEPSYSMAPVAIRLSELLGRPVTLAADITGPSARAAVFEKPVPGREADVAGGVGEQAQMISGHAVQERVGGQSRRVHLDHGKSPPGVIVSVGPVLQAPCAFGQCRKSLAGRDHGRRPDAVQRGVIRWTNVPAGHAGGHSPMGSVLPRLAL